jgi:hypothetical protein
MAPGDASAARKGRSSANASTEVGNRLDDTSVMAALVGRVVEGATVSFWMPPRIRGMGK